MDLIKELKSLPNQRSPWNQWLDNKNQYDYYFKLIKEYNPDSILEIGTCLGYFLVSAIFSKPDLNKIFWIDNESYEKNSNLLAKENINYICNKIQSKCSINYSNNYLDIIDKYDLIHIDGDHSYKGCLFDLNFSFSLKPKIIIGHDYNLEPEVKKAVDHFCEINKIKFEVLNDFKHGLYVIKL